MIFNHAMSDTMRLFLNNLSWSFYGGLIAMPVTVVVSTLAGRFLGPAEFGKYNLVVLISSYVISFSFLGLDISTVKNIAKAKSRLEKEQSFFSSFVFVVALALIFCLIGLFFGPKISSRFGFDNMIILFVVYYTMTMTLKLIMDVLCRALEKFQLQAIAKIVENAVMVLGFVLVMLVSRKINFSTYTATVLFGAVAMTVIYILKFKGYFKNFSFSVLSKQLAEGKFFMISGLLGTIFLSSDRLLIAKYIDISTVGIYSAYYVASLGLVSSLSALVTNVLLPATAKTEDKTFIYKIEKLCLKGFVPVYLALCVAILIFLEIFGKAYPMKPSYILLFALVATLNFIMTIYNTIILDSGRRRYVTYIIINNVLNLLNIAYYFVLLQYFSKSIDLVLVGLAVNLGLSIVAMVILTRNMLKESRNAVL